ncbi:hypothetical protein WME97_43435 [Sorangium sp. So ce367]|uniref:hypothetical protein n=1 Tax=Sorangium sp. So ce367 TaxID=3133305 RepID=UPI003F649093
MKPVSSSFENLADDLTELLDQADLDEEQQKKVEREFARQYHLITREERLDTIAGDIVTHFPRRRRRRGEGQERVVLGRREEQVQRLSYVGVLVLGSTMVAAYRTSPANDATSA